MITVVGSLKGGTGKSTLTFNLAVWLAHARQRVHLIDADPQATLSDVVEVRTEEGYKPPLRVESAKALDAKIGKDTDEVLIDVGTADMASLKKAIAMADRVVMPVPPSQADVWSAQRFITLAREAAGENIQILSFINRADTHRAVRETDEAAAALVTLPGLAYLKTRLAARTLYRRSFSEGLAVFEMEPRGKAAQEVRALCAQLYPHVLHD
jgi:chromosome partitioning protein